MQINTDKKNVLAPAFVRAGERLKAATINALIRASGSPRTIAENKLPFKSSGSGGVYPFKVIKDPADATKVAVRGGLWDITVDGITVNSLQIGGAGDFVGTGPLPTDIANTASSIADGETAWVYLLVVGAADGEITTAASLKAMFITGSPATRPQEDTIAGGPYQATSIKVLAKVTRTGATVTITQEWTGGDIKTKAMVLDGADVIDAGGALSSLSYNSVGAMEVSGFEVAAEGQTPYSSADSAPKSLGWEYGNTVNSDATGLNAAVLTSRLSIGSNRYIDSGEYEYTVGPATPAVSPNGFSDMTFLSPIQLDIWPVCDAWLAQFTGDIHTHATHTDFTDDSHDGVGSRTGYVRLDGDAERNAMSGAIGDSSDVNSILPDTRTLNDSGGVVTTDWENKQLEDAATVVLDWSTRTLDGADWQVASGTIFNIDDTTPTGVGTGALVCDGGAWFAKGVYGKAAVGSSGGVFEDSGGANFVNLGLDLYSMYAFGDVRVDTGDIAITTSGNYSHLGNQGQTISNWTSGGLLSGSNIVEKELQNMAPTDKVLVIV